MFAAAVTAAADGPDGEVPVHAIERIVDETPALRAGYLYRLEAIQRAAADEARHRARRTGNPYPLDDPTPEAHATRWLR